MQSCQLKLFSFLPVDLLNPLCVPVVMTTAHRQENPHDGAEASVTASRNHTPERREENPDLRRVLEQLRSVQARLAQTEQELSNIREERDICQGHEVRSDESYTPDTHSRQIGENFPTYSSTVNTRGSGSTLIPNTAPTV